MSNASNTLPKEQQTAFQRWELASFGDERRSHTQQLNQEQNKEQAELAQAELAKLQQLAQQEGQALGYKEGYKEGFEQGFREGLQAGSAEAGINALHIQNIAKEFQDQLVNSHQLIGRDLVALAVDLAQAIIKKQIELDHSVILPIVREAIEQLHEVQQPAHIYAHPEDALILRQHINEEVDLSDWKIMSDSNLERGGCRLETAHNLVDASLSTRWNRLSEAIIMTSQQSSIQATEI
jgi:flagellar assembly protein FliH